jgi:predicted PurR-regulated permease PerM
MEKFWRPYSYFLLGLMLSLALLYFAKPLFMPLALAAMLALVFTPFCQWMEKAGVPSVVGAIVCGILFTGLVAGILLLVNWYLHRFMSDLPQVRQRLGDLADSLRSYLHDQWGIRIAGPSGIPSRLVPDAGKMTGSALGGIITVLIHFILTLVYMIMLLSMRNHVRTFFMKLAPADSRPQTRRILRKSILVAQEYLYGMMIIIACLWVMYSIGFSLVGVRYAIFFAILCGLLEIVPFVGNITGSTLTSLMALSQGGGGGMVAGVLVTYAIIQFIQFYIISPLVMRSQVNLNPLFTIACLVAGELLWGIPGMILAIPCLGMIKVVCDEVEYLRPFGHLFGRSVVRKPIRFRRGKGMS